MKRFLTLMVVAALQFAVGHSFAQNVYFNLGAAIPVGDFAEGDNQGFALLNEDTEAGAGFGFTAGLKLKFDTKMNGLGIIATVDGVYNGLNTEMKEVFEDLSDYYDNQFTGDFSLKTPKYINLPAMLGVNYTYGIKTDLSIYGVVALGANLRVITNLEMEGRSGSYKFSETYNYNTAFSFAYQLGVGLEFSKNIAIGIDYYDLGTAKVKGKLTQKDSYGNDSEKFKLKRITPVLVMLRLSYKF